MNLRNQVQPDIKVYDRYLKKIVNGSIININQTVNGENIFVVMDINSLDVRYGRDLQRHYEYDVMELLDIKNVWGGECIEIVGNIYDYINNIRSK